MTELVQRRDRIAIPFVGVALAASLFGGIVGGAVAVVVPTVIDSPVDEGAAERAKWIKYGQEWESRYRQMYPTSL